ncbi:GntR family transcriptional regulator / MocR family aminotransferase [Frateuria terrea]|uniref:GntR family transcriptional regulator / MocR family aminotransferase n=2 Tax=Frateuria terrea TaxID=529704 RepID=A0A1H6ZNE8_9GAMM|nr:GntR family transcriptional regulator / MocR family aminotransferase [Frateuria terrea]SFP79233.1 GntR family transcriptional regulator / MocR family aminotransferase [Frateuria terrea]
MANRRQNDEPMYARIAESIRRDIDGGRFKVRARLPGSRSMAVALGVSRTVVLMAYDQLESEGYLDSQSGSGTYVSARPARASACATLVEEPVEAPEAPRLSRLARRAVLPAVPEAEPPAAEGEVIDLAQPRVKSDRRSLKAWMQNLTALLRRRDAPDFPELQGALDLRKAVAGYLGVERAIAVDPDDILIVSGAQQARDLIARVLLDEGDGAGVEEPCHWSVRHTYEAMGARLVPCQVGPHGMDIDRHAAALDGVRLVSVAPSFQFPTGVVMPEERRRALLQWAYAHDACLVEDDFDCEHRFGVRALPSLWSLDRHGRVIHVSSFARSMFPALQLGYMLVPRALRERFLAVKWLADRGSISMQQHVLAACISSGQYLRDLRRIAHRLAPRHRALHDTLQARLGDAMEVTGSVAGGSLFVRLPRLPLSATGTLLAEALARGVRIRSAERFHRVPPDHVTLVLSYAGLSETSLKRAGARLAEACLAVANA